MWLQFYTPRRDVSSRILWKKIVSNLDEQVVLVFLHDDLHEHLQNNIIAKSIAMKDKTSWSNMYIHEYNNARKRNIIRILTKYLDVRGPQATVLVLQLRAL